MPPHAPELPPYRPQLLRNVSTHSKISIPSISHSNEADDEQSLSDQSIDMESNPEQPHYEGEDTRLTSEKELRGFYMYGWAAEVLYILILPCSNITLCFLSFMSLLKAISTNTLRQLRLQTSPAHIAVRPTD